MIQVQCVLVLYKQRWEEAKSLRSLLEICKQEQSIASRIALFVQDNSPEVNAPVAVDTSLQLEYYRAPGNPGLAEAYNRALAIARDRNVHWLLLLDQDTTLDRRFLLQLFAAVEGSASPQVCAFVPELVKDDLVLSPQTVGRVFYHRLPIGFSGLASKPLVAFNSASCLNVAAMTAIGGFPGEYWLDYLDHIVFQRLQAAGGRVYVLDSQLKHNLSLQNIEAEVSIERYSNVLAAEWRYVKDTHGGSLLHRMRLLKRTLMQALKLKDKSYARLTLQFAWRGSSAARKPENPAWPPDFPCS
jgi:GT2 family glycosyltransferase